MQAQKANFLKIVNRKTFVETPVCLYIERNSVLVSKSAHKVENEEIKAVTGHLPLKVMTLIDEIKTRRSVRKYTEQPVTKEDLQVLLEAASFAPSAHNAQPWRFMVLTEYQSKADLANSMAKAWLRELGKDHVPKKTRLKLAQTSVNQFTKAPVLVLACMTLEDMEKYPDTERQQYERDLAIQSLAAAIQNLLLAAHAKGLGACWYCAPIFCKLAVRKVLRIPEKVEPQALITVGYPAELPKVPRRKSHDSFVHVEKW